MDNRELDNIEVRFMAAGDAALKDSSPITNFLALPCFAVAVLCDIAKQLREHNRLTGTDPSRVG